MKTIFETLRSGFLSVAMLPLALNAQEESKSGFVRLTNAVAEGTGQLTMEIDGKKVNDKGYKLGSVTGGIALSPGGHTMKFSREGTKEGSTRVNIAANETTILIPYAEKVPATDDEPARWDIRILRLKQRDPEEERSATFVSVSKQPEIKVEMRDPEGKWKAVFVKRLAVAQAPILYPRGYVPLRTADGDLVSIPVASKGNYVVLLYDDEQGKVRSLNFKDRKFLSAD
jgi:hypothetical protein